MADAARDILSDRITALAEGSGFEAPAEDDPDAKTLGRGIGELAGDYTADRRHAAGFRALVGTRGIKRSKLADLLPWRVWRRIEPMGGPDIDGEPSAQRLNCITIAALIETALVDWPHLDSGTLHHHAEQERELAAAFKDLADRQRRKGLYR